MTVDYMELPRYHTIGYEVLHRHIWAYTLFHIKGFVMIEINHFDMFRL